MFDWNDLTFLLDLARQGRLMLAARRLKVDHTTVSRRIADLERALDVKLFNRAPDGFALTEPGNKLKGLAEAIERKALAIPEALGVHDAVQPRESGHLGRHCGLLPRSEVP